MSRRTRAAQPIRSDFGPEIVDPTTGEVRYAIPITVEDVAEGTRATVRRARRHDPLEDIPDVDRNMIEAADRFRDAFEGMHAGRGREATSDEPRVGFDRTRLLPQERALTSAMDYRLGEQAMGMIATGKHGVVTLVVLRRMSCNEVDEFWQRRKGSAKPLLVEALTRLARAYGYA
jgi:hypothetical protein